jgi:hypothetical protein
MGAQIPASSGDLDLSRHWHWQDAVESLRIVLAADEAGGG